jgi:hypothetical protein
MSVRIITNPKFLIMRRKAWFLFVVTRLISGSLLSQQVADTSFNPVISRPEYAMGKGPVILIDEGHNNFHTTGGRYLPFAMLLRTDGYVVKGTAGEFKEPGLNKARILVIANALNSLNTQNWFLPTPSAFTDPEIDIVKRWVRTGGSLFLIADHMPMGGAAAGLATAMFTAQLAGPSKTQVGMNSDYAGENYKLLLNIIHWLDLKFE